MLSYQNTYLSYQLINKINYENVDNSGFFHNNVLVSHNMIAITIFIIGNCSLYKNLNDIMRKNNIQ